MDWLNYHHLHYFWVVAKEGSIARATRRLHLAQPTISAQIRALEGSLGERLFERAGRGLALTETGRVVFGYAEEIFALGRELTDTVKDRPTGKPLRLTVGVTDSLPKPVARRLIEPAFSLDAKVRILCREGSPERLMSELSLHAVDIVLSDSPAGITRDVRSFHHLLGECGVSIFAPARRGARLRAGFPRSLDGIPFLLPASGSSLRRSLDLYFEREGIRPETVGEFEDSALLMAFAEGGHGAFAAPSVVEDEIARKPGIRLVGRLPEIRERFYAITVERKVRHPAIAAITEAARAAFPAVPG